jgi:WD40 repeat protein
MSRRTIAVTGLAITALVLAAGAFTYPFLRDHYNSWLTENSGEQVQAQEPKARATPSAQRGQVFCLAFSPDGRILASGGHDNLVKLRGPRTGRERVVLKGHNDRVTCVAFSADSKTLASGSADGEVKFWELPRPEAPRLQ